MAQTVGYPCAIAAHLVLKGRLSTCSLSSLNLGQLKSPGMVTPLAKEIYQPILAELAKLGITARRTLSKRQ